jgi:hypothetical protein
MYPWKSFKQDCTTFIRERPENLEQFINLRITRKKRFLVHHFSKNATN